VIDRYFKGDVRITDGRGHAAGGMCVHCENAPCEQVCPVAATVHSDEGLNDMVYNRCVGTRYCSQQLPVQGAPIQLTTTITASPARVEEAVAGRPSSVQVDEIKQLVHNPDVTVRMREA
jgi:Fe-S-cluster-containing dehydrogenase component